MSTFLSLVYFNVALAHNEYVILFYSNYDDF